MTNTAAPFPCGPVALCICKDQNSAFLIHHLWGKKKNLMSSKQSNNALQINVNGKCSCSTCESTVRVFRTNSQCVQLGFFRKENAKIFLLSLATDTHYNKWFIMRKTNMAFRIPWRNLAKRSHLSGLTMRCPEIVMHQIQSDGSGLQTFQGPWRTTVKYLYF